MRCGFISFLSCIFVLSLFSLFSTTLVFAFAPTRHMVVSSSYGGDSKVWAYSHEIRQRYQTLQNSGWTCHVVGSYKRKLMIAATFFADAFVLAIVVETVIIIWDPEKIVQVACRLLMHLLSLVTVM